MAPLPRVTSASRASLACPKRHGNTAQPSAHRTGPGRLRIVIAVRHVEGQVFARRFGWHPCLSSGLAFLLKRSSLRLAEGRPQFKALLGQIRDGETLAVSKLDRLGRDAQDVGATIKALAARKIELIVLQLGKLDPTSSAGKLMLTMLAAVAEMERDVLVERTQSGLARARAKAEGKRLGRPTRTTEAQRSDGSEVCGAGRIGQCVGSGVWHLPR